MFVMKILSCQSAIVKPKHVHILRARNYVRALSTKPPVNDQNCEALKSNPYFDKYAEKINDMKATSPDELQKRLLALLERKNLKDPAATPIQTKTKKLEDLKMVDSLHGKPSSEVKTSWDSFQGEEHRFTITLSSEVYKKIEERGRCYPTFLFPLPRAKGFEYIVSQFSGHEIHFSPLINYQKFKENAPECLAVTHFTDIENSTKLVLVLGEFNTEVLDRTEALCLYHQLQRYYGEDDPRRLRIIQQFTNSPLNFHHMDLIAELESLSQRQTGKNS